MRIIKKFEDFIKENKEVDDLLDKMNHVGGYNNLSISDKKKLDAFSKGNTIKDDFIGTKLYCLAEIIKDDYSDIYMFVYEVEDIKASCLIINLIEGNEYCQEHDIDTTLNLYLDESELESLKDNGVIYFEINENFALTICIDEDTIMDMLDNM